jgi:hypothetical protein
VRRNAAGQLRSVTSGNRTDASASIRNVCAVSIDRNFACTLRVLAPSSSEFLPDEHAEVFQEMDAS